jgi:hypothetical protein
MRLTDHVTLNLKQEHSLWLQCFGILKSSIQRGTLACCVLIASKSSWNLIIRYFSIMSWKHSWCHFRASSVIIGISVIVSWLFLWVGREKRLVVSLKRFNMKSKWLAMEALCYKREGRGFETQWSNLKFFNLPISSSHTRPWVLLSL